MSDKIEQFWRDATADDVARVVRGEKVEARFRDYEHRGWWSSVLNGWRDERDRSWLDSDGAGWRSCQVYEPPQWWRDKPDPGEGWRLLDPFTDEQPAVGDCIFSKSSKRWVELKAILMPGRRPEAWYRRRIEPVNSPEKLDSSPCASTIPKGWTALSDDEPRLASDAFWSIGAKDWVIIGDARLEYANRDKWPAIRQVETHKSLQLAAGYTYRLPSGAIIIATKNGFEVF